MKKIIEKGKKFSATYECRGYEIKKEFDGCLGRILWVVRDGSHYPVTWSDKLKDCEKWALTH